MKLEKLLKPFKIEALNYRDMEDVSDIMIVKSLQVSNLMKQYLKSRGENLGFKL